MGGSADPQNRLNTNRGGSSTDKKNMYNLHLFIYIFCTINRWLEGKKKGRKGNSKFNVERNKITADTSNLDRGYSECFNV